MSKIISRPVGDSIVPDFLNLDNVTWSGNQNNLPFPVGGSGFRVTLDTATIYIRGIDAASHGTMLLIYNGANIGGTYNIRIQNLHASGTVGNKFVNVGTSDITILRYRNVYVRYDNTLDSGNGAWHVLSG